MSLFDEIKATSSSEYIYYNDNPCDKVYFNDKLIWCRKNTSVITWPDALTISPQIRGKYTGDRNSANCSAHGGCDFYGCPASGTEICTGKIPVGCKTIEIKYQAVDYISGQKGSIYYVDGTEVAKLKNGINNVSQYADGLHYFKYYCTAVCGIGSEPAWGGMNLWVTLSS